MIIEPRVEEIFQLIREQVESLGFPGEPAGGYVLTGGVMSTPHILEVARAQLGHAVRIVSPTACGCGGSFLYRRGGDGSLYPADAGCTGSPNMTTGVTRPSEIKTNPQPG